VSDTYFVLTESGYAGGLPAAGRFRAQTATGGPWAPHLQHGGPPNALAVAAAEAAVAQQTARHDLVAVRLASDFIAPVPVGELAVRTSILRAARSAALVEVRLAATGTGGERDCLLSRVWFVRVTDTSAVSPPLAEPAELPTAAAGLDLDFPYGRSLEWRFVRGQLGTPGPAAAWVRPRTELLPGYRMSALARAVLVADSASGISAELSWQDWTFLNVDLDVHLSRQPDGDWLLMDAKTHLGPSGAAVARSTLSDVYGVCGAGLQTLVLAPTARPPDDPGNSGPSR
jgi:hypothetical protein